MMNFTDSEPIVMKLFKWKRFVSWFLFSFNCLLIFILFQLSLDFYSLSVVSWFLFSFNCLLIFILFQLSLDFYSLLIVSWFWFSFNWLLAVTNEIPCKTCFQKHKKAEWERLHPPANVERQITTAKSVAYKNPLPKTEYVHLHSTASLT